ncbi:MAG: hypothetical protein IJ348_04995 [Alistipes sp.]|nr:hypothetical protein [Alistipes sp.]
MRGFVITLLLLLGTCFVPSERPCAISNPHKVQEHLLLRSDYAQEITCERRCNPLAESHVQPSVAPTSTTATPHRTPAPRLLLGGSTMHATASGAAYCAEFNAYRLCSRVIEYYLYALCVLRL